MPNPILLCPNCDHPCDRDEVDVGVGVIYGPWRCDGCRWGEWMERQPIFTDDFTDETDETDFDFTDPNKDG